MNPKQPSERYASCPKSQRSYEIEGKRYEVTRHFTGEKKIGQAVAEFAIGRADRETGLL